MTTAAAIDRLVHHCVILELTGPSYRTEKALNKKQVWEITNDGSNDPPSIRNRELIVNYAQV
jgi:hypothetical protein